MVPVVKTAKNNKEIITIKKEVRNFAGGPVVKTALSFHYLFLL